MAATALAGWARHSVGACLQGALSSSRALCAAAASQQDVWATNITLRKEKVLEVEFNTGQCFTLPAEYLRVYSPAAGNLDARDARGRPKVAHGRRNVGIIGVHPVGSYAVRLEFDDMHTSGIFTWPYLHDLGQHKLSRMRAYLRLLRERGLSRDPPRWQPRQRAAAAQQGSSRAGGGDGGGIQGSSSSGSGTGGGGSNKAAYS